MLLYGNLCILKYSKSILQLFYTFCCTLSIYAGYYLCVFLYNTVEAVDFHKFIIYILGQLHMHILGFNN